MRQLYCARRLAREYDIAVTGFDTALIPAELALRTADPASGEKFGCAVLPVPPLNSSGNLSTPCFSENITVSDIEKMIETDSIIFTGRAGDLGNAFSGHTVYDYLEREDLSIKNAIPTAEGAVQIALSELPVTLNGLKVLIVGLGRIGTALAQVLKGFGADVTASVRNSRGSAKARILGIRSVCTGNMDTDYELVFNTVPDLIFDRELLSRFSRSTLFIDLASKPGGIDFDSAAELGIKAVWALGLPGKSAPVTAGILIAETVSGMLAERGSSDV